VWPRGSHQHADIAFSDSTRRRTVAVFILGADSAVQLPLDNFR
jgi:hypothetical protein